MAIPSLEQKCQLGSRLNDEVLCLPTSTRWSSSSQCFTRRHSLHRRALPWPQSRHLKEPSALQHRVHLAWFMKGPRPSWRSSSSSVESLSTIHWTSLDWDDEYHMVKTEERQAYFVCPVIAVSLQTWRSTWRRRHGVLCAGLRIIQFVEPVCGRGCIRKHFGRWYLASELLCLRPQVTVFWYFQCCDPGFVDVMLGCRCPRRSTTEGGQARSFRSFGIVCQWWTKIVCRHRLVVEGKRGVRVRQDMR